MLSHSFFFFKEIHVLLFIYLFMTVFFVSVRGLSLVAASGDHSSSQCAGLSPSRPLLLRSTGSVIVAHGPSCSAARGIFPDQGLNPCPLHWQADSQPLRHQGSPDAILSGTLFLISFSNSSLVVYRKTTDFYILILYPKTFLNAFVSSNSFYGIFGVSYIQYQVICT